MRPSPPVVPGSASPSVSGPGNSKPWLLLAIALAAAASVVVMAVHVTAPALSVALKPSGAATNVAATVPAVAPVSSKAAGAVALLPSVPTAVGKGGHLTFTAAVTGAARGRVTWSVDAIPGGDATVGTISAAGVYTCPAVSAQAIHTITATSVASPGVSASVRILATVSNITLNAKTQYGATGNGSTDDTAAINSALAATGNGICLLPAGTYMVNPTAVDKNKGIVLNPGNTLLLAPGAVIQTITQTVSSQYHTIAMSALGTCNMAVVGGTVHGDRKTARNPGGRDLPNANTGLGSDDPKDFEYGLGIGIYNGSGHVLLGVTADDCCCDGICIAQGAANPSNVVIEDCVSNNNRRQALTIEAGSNVLLKNCTFTGTNGQDPACGIDMEPSASSQTITNVQILGCTVTGNQGGGIAAGAKYALTSQITINGCTITANGGHDFGLAGIDISDVVSHFTITNNTVTGNLSSGSGHQGGIAISSEVSHANMTVNDNTVTGNAGYGLSFAHATGTTFSRNTVRGNSSGQIRNDGSASAK